MMEPVLKKVGYSSSNILLEKSQLTNKNSLLTQSMSNKGLYHWNDNYQLFTRLLVRRPTTAIQSPPTAGGILIDH